MMAISSSGSCSTQPVPRIESGGARERDERRHLARLVDDEARVLVVPWSMARVFMLSSSAMENSCEPCAASRGSMESGT